MHIPQISKGSKAVFNNCTNPSVLAHDGFLFYVCIVVVVVVVAVDDDVIVVLAFLMSIPPLLTAAPELVLTIPKCLPAAFCWAHLTIRCIGSRLVLGSEPPATADDDNDNPDYQSCSL